MTEHIVYARHLRLNLVDDFEPAPASEGATPVDALPLVVRGSLRVGVGDRAFDLTEDGLYQFWDYGPHTWSSPGAPPEPVGQPAARYHAVVIWSVDVLPLLGALSALQVHGFADNGLTDDALRDKGRGDLLRISCGRTTALTIRLLGEQGVRARQVQGLKSAGRLDGRDDGHVLFELQAGSRWILADVDMRVLFVGPDGEFLNLLEFWLALRAGQGFSFFPLCPPGVGLYDSADPVAATRMAPVFENPQLLARWYARVLGMPLILDADGFSYAPTDHPALVERVTRYAPSFRCLPAETWRTRFYG